jgi:enterochelin esterase-like enzyme
MDDPTPAQTAQPRAETSTSSVVGDLRLHEFKSKIFRNARWLRVWLPPGYEASDSQAIRYPVLYLNDGQNLFDRATAFAGVEWEVDETADRLIRSGVIPPMILVGIDNAQKERIREYVPYCSLNPPILRPQGRHYPDFLMHEVMPFVQQQYRVALGPANTGLGGSSLGALIALYTVLVRPGIFGRLLLESPSLFLSHRSLLKETMNLRRWPQRIFLAIGTREVGREDRDRAVVEDVRRLERNLRRSGLGDDRVQVEIEEGALHNEAAWGQRFPSALKFLFE